MACHYELAKEASASVSLFVARRIDFSLLFVFSSIFDVVFIGFVYVLEEFACATLCAIVDRIGHRIRAVRRARATSAGCLVLSSAALRANLQTARIRRGNKYSVRACAYLGPPAACVAHCPPADRWLLEKASSPALLTVTSRLPLHITLKRTEWNRVTTDGSDCGKIIARRTDIRRLQRQQHYAERQK